MKTIKINNQTKKFFLKNFELVDEILWCDCSLEILSILLPATIIIIIIIIIIIMIMIIAVQKTLCKGNEWITYGPF